MKSIIQSNKECFIRKVNYDASTISGLHEHHFLKELLEENKVKNMV